MIRNVDLEGRGHTKSKPSIIHVFFFIPQTSPDKELLQSLMDMFFGGITSTLAGLEYTLMYLTQNPKIQQLAQTEIDKVAEMRKSITFSDRENMPYVRACITEALRLGAVTASSLPHVTTEPTEVSHCRASLQSIQR